MWFSFLMLDPEYTFGEDCDERAALVAETTC